VISVWCLGIAYDLEAALHRAIDLLRPGGRLAIMDFYRSRPDHGILHWLYPVYSFILRNGGISGAEELDDDKLRSRWDKGRRLLKERLVDVWEERYLQGGGLIIAGQKPAEE
jgi:SAM-dependent methyltransferase